MIVICPQGIRLRDELAPTPWPWSASSLGMFLVFRSFEAGRVSRLIRGMPSVRSTHIDRYWRADLALMVVRIDPAVVTTGTTESGRSVAAGELSRHAGGGSSQAHAFVFDLIRGHPLRSNQPDSEGHIIGSAEHGRRDVPDGEIGEIVEVFRFSVLDPEASRCRDELFALLLGW